MTAARHTPLVAPPHGTQCIAAAAAAGAAIAVCLFLVLLPWYPGAPRLAVGSRAPFTLHAPRDLSFTSTALTERVRAQAAAAVPERMRLDPTVRDRQVALLRQQIATIDGVRHDQTMSEGGRAATIRGVPGSALTQQSAVVLAGINDAAWQVISGDAVDALTRTLSGAVARDGLDDARARMAGLLSPVLTGAQLTALRELVDPLVAPTLVVDEERTASLRAEARAARPPVQVTRARGETLVARGEEITAVTAELLEHAGLRRTGATPAAIGAAAAMALLLGLIAAGYLAAHEAGAFVRAPIGARRVMTVALIIVFSVAVKFAAALALPDVQRHFLMFVLPLAAAPIAAAALADAGAALIIAVVLAMIATWTAVVTPLADTAGGVQLEAARVLLVTLGGSVAGLAVAVRAERMRRFALAAVAAAVVAAVALLASWLVDPDRQWRDLAWMGGALAVSALLTAAIAAGAFVLLARRLGVLTRVALTNSAQFTQPLLRRLQDEAPGTFQHSMLVGSLAERAAERIGADGLLVRVGAYYHDVGKLVAPAFFVENFGENESPHDALDPLQSTRVIHQHVTAGIELARRAGLPEPVVRFIPEHHGTRTTAFFYRRAAAEDPEADPDLFRYRGPRPQSRETALVMLADSAEATVRASPDHSAERIRQIIAEIVRERIEEGQLDECALSLRDLRAVEETFASMLNAVYHPRVEYPEPTARERRERQRIVLDPPTSAAAVTDEPAEPREP